MKNRRRFSLEQKRQIVEDLLSGAVPLAQLCQRHSVAAGQVQVWRRQYEQGLFSPEAREVTALQERIQRLERKVGQMALENDFLKTALTRYGSRRLKNGPWSGPRTNSASLGDAN
jgi:transposase